MIIQLSGQGITSIEIGIKETEDGESTAGNLLWFTKQFSSKVLELSSQV